MYILNVTTASLQLILSTCYCT